MLTPSLLNCSTPDFNSELPLTNCEVPSDNWLLACDNCSPDVDKVLTPSFICAEPDFKVELP